jgi:hypothetical protein
LWLLALPLLRPIVRLLLATLLLLLLMPVTLLVVPTLRFLLLVMLLQLRAPTDRSPANRNKRYDSTAIGYY